MWQLAQFVLSARNGAGRIDAVQAGMRPSWRFAQGHGLRCVPVRRRGLFLAPGAPGASRGRTAYRWSDRFVPVRRRVSRTFVRPDARRAILTMVIGSARASAASVRRSLLELVGEQRASHLTTSALQELLEGLEAVTRTSEPLN